MVSFVCAEVRDTERLGRILGQFCQDGDVILLDGDLGTGKTCLVTAAADAMGVPAGEVTSPTFSLMNVYHGTRYNIKHFDLYRISWPEELEDIGFEEYCGGDGVTFVEWAGLFPDMMPLEALQVQLSRDNEGRKAEITAHGTRYEQLLQDIQAAWNADKEGIPC